MSHDESTQTVTAIGDVELIQGERILRADKVVYQLSTDTVSAIGNVSLLDETGDIHFFEYVELSDQMKEGYVQSLLSLLADGTRFTAVEGRREGGTKITMTEATYTPCNVCETNPKPLWQIKADKVVHDETTKTVKYENARFELAGIPFAYTPFFSHADPSVKRKSGFLRPRYGFSSDVGAYVEGGYYFGDIAPDKDATLLVRPTTQQGVLVQGEWRQRFENGRLKISGSGVQSDRKEQDGRVEENRNRGHIFAEGQFDLDEKWRTGFNVRQASDKNYLRLYDISDENVLNNSIYAERFSGRHYTTLNARSFRDIRLGDRPKQPTIFPSVEHKMIGNPGALFGGRWDAGISALALFRNEDNAQDVQRVSANLGWERRETSNTGLTTRLHAGARGDLYKVRDNIAIPPGDEDDTEAARGTAVVGIQSSYPMVRRMQRSHILIEPVVGLNASPNLNDNDPEIPNEDSLDIQIDTANIFDDNRFTGVDRQEDGIRAGYGLKSGIYADDGRFIKTFVGQSYRFEDDSIYPEGSGLEDKGSDIVGQINIGLHSALQADYRFQLDNHDLTVQRHEARATAILGKTRLSSRYIFAGGIAGTDFEETREQLQFGGQYSFNPFWDAYANSLLDLGEEPGLRRGLLGLRYADECFSFTAEGSRNLISPAAGESETVVMLRVGFKNIGEFSAPQILLKNTQEQ